MVYVVLRTYYKATFLGQSNRKTECTIQYKAMAHIHTQAAYTEEEEDNHDYFIWYYVCLYQKT